MKTVIHLQWNRQYTFVVWIILSRKLIILFKINRNVRLWNMICNLFAVHVKLLKLKGNASWENTEKNICMTAWNQLPIGVFSIVFVLPVIQSVLAQLLGKAVVVTIIIGDFILTWASHEQNNRETCFIHLYKAIQIDEWDNIMIINNWKNKQVSGWNKFWQLH